MTRRNLPSGCTFRYTFTSQIPPAVAVAHKPQPPQLSGCTFRALPSPPGRPPRQNEACESKLLERLSDCTSRRTFTARTPASTNEAHDGNTLTASRAVHAIVPAHF
eukprot:jgi/Botrbrau1/20658/Bobra.0703s0003.1